MRAGIRTGLEHMRAGIRTGDQKQVTKNILSFRIIYITIDRRDILERKSNM